MNSRKTAPPKVFCIEIFDAERHADVCQLPFEDENHTILLRLRQEEDQLVVVIAIPFSQNVLTIAPYISEALWQQKPHQKARGAAHDAPDTPASQTPEEALQGQDQMRR